MVLVLQINKSIAVPEAVREVNSRESRRQHTHHVAPQAERPWRRSNLAQVAVQDLDLLAEKGAGVRDYEPLVGESGGMKRM